MLSISLVQISLYSNFHHTSFSEIAMKMILNLRFGIQPKLKPYFFFFLNLLLWELWACIQNVIILALVVFEIAMKKTLNLCFGRQPKLERLFFIFCFNFLVGWACIQNSIILAFVSFEIAIKKTLNLRFWRRP